ncbi:Clp protease N-terminal domain-containing protein [Streptomyces sp. NBC_01614]|uniref:Clp protease N-terminal domain-containing protein n=1 Tax=Streptomyces sp. NBC_00180 TaxID=2903632 RepID=A0AAU1HXV4_9ACTN
MDQRASAAVRNGATDVAGTTVEFECDVVDLFVAALRGALKQEAAVVGTENLLAALVMGDTDAGAAIAPGMRKAGSLSGLIAGRGGRGWVSDDGDEDAGATVAAGADDDEVTAAWREAHWRLGPAKRGPAADVARELPGMTGALRRCLLLALAAARAEGTVPVRCRHVARALLDLPESRAREALVLQKLDLAAAATALDALDASAPAETELPESRGVTLLRRAGTLGRSGNRLTRALTSWTSGAGVYGSPIVFAVTVEAVRQAVRCGRSAAEPVDLLLGILALDRSLAVAGRPLPEDLAAANSAAALLRRHGVRQDSLTRSAMERTPTAPADSASASDRDAGQVRLSDSAERAKAVAQLTAVEHGSPSVGTVHLLAALVEAEGTEVVRLLSAASRVDVAALRAELPRRAGA